MENIENQLFVVDAYAKIKQVMSGYDEKDVRVAYSGGSDSDTILFILRHLGYNVRSVFYDTGLEYDATWRHLDHMRSKGFIIDVEKAKMAIPTSNKKYGSPFISKRVSDRMQRLQKHNFQFKSHGNLSFEKLWKIYPNSKSALEWWTNSLKAKSLNISWNKNLKEFLIENDGLPFKVSDRCCDGAKKNPAKHYAKRNDVKLMILGLRRAEGGRRVVHKNCFIKSKSYTYDMFFPLFWWRDNEKNMFDEAYEIEHSECYSKYGMKRTGCAGCPFNRWFEKELNIIEEYEPKLFKGIGNIFKDSYEWTKKYRNFQLNNK